MLTFFQGSDQLFITTGNSKSSEIIAVTHSTRCIAPADYPLRVEGAVGTFVEERPLICGGRSSIEDYHDDCFHYNIYNNRSARKIVVSVVTPQPRGNRSIFCTKNTSRPPKDLVAEA